MQAGFEPGGEGAVGAEQSAGGDDPFPGTGLQGPDRLGEMVGGLVQDGQGDGVPGRLDDEGREPCQADGGLRHDGGEHVPAVGLAVRAGPGNAGVGRNAVPGGTGNTAPATGPVRGGDAGEPARATRSVRGVRVLAERPDHDTAGRGGRRPAGQHVVGHAQFPSHRRRQHRRRAPAVGHPEGGPDRRPADPEAAAVVAEEPAVAVHGGGAAASGDAHGDRAGARHQGESVGRGSRCAGEGRLDVAADEGRAGVDAQAAQGGREGGQGVAPPRLVGGGVRRARETTGDGHDPVPDRFRYGPRERLGEVLGELRPGDGQGVARPGGALAQRTSVLGGRQDRPGARAARVDTDHQGGGALTLLVQFITHRRLW